MLSEKRQGYLASKAPLILDPLLRLGLLLCDLEPQELFLLSSFFIVAIQSIFDLIVRDQHPWPNITRRTTIDRTLISLTLSLHPLFFWISCSFLTSP